MLDISSGINILLFEFFFLGAEKARIEAEVKAAEAAARMKAEAAMKMQREREREAARLALQKVLLHIHFLSVAN